MFWFHDFRYLLKSQNHINKKHIGIIFSIFIIFIEWDFKFLSVWPLILLNSTEQLFFPFVKCLNHVSALLCLRTWLNDLRYRGISVQTIKLACFRHKKSKNCSIIYYFMTQFSSDKNSYCFHNDSISKWNVHR